MTLTRREKAILRCPDPASVYEVFRWPFDTPLSAMGRFQKWRSLIDGQEVSAIPDNEVWQSKESSADFWEEYSTRFFYDNDSNGVIIGTDFEGQSAAEDSVDEVMENRDSKWQHEGEVTDVESSHSVSTNDGGFYEWSFFVDDDRYVNRIDNGGGESGDGAITVLSSLDISGANSLHYYIDHYDDGSATAGSALVISDVGSDEEYELVTIVDTNSAEDDSYDISDLSGEKDVLLIHGQGTSSNPHVDWADIYFE